MKRAARRRGRAGGLSSSQRLGWVLVAVFLVVAPAFDYAWAEPRRTDGPGARCQLHANPVLTGQPLSPAPAFELQALVVVEPLVRPSLVPPSIFIPPRA